MKKIEGDDNTPYFFLHDSLSTMFVRPLDETKLREHADVLSLYGIQPEGVLRAFLGSGITTNRPEVVGYLMAVTDMPLGEVTISSDFSTTESVANLYTELTGLKETFPDDASAYEQFASLTNNEPFCVVVHIDDFLPQDALVKNPHILPFIHVMQNLLEQNKGFKVIAYSSRQEAIPSLLQRNLYQLYK